MLLAFLPVGLNWGLLNVLQAIFAGCTLVLQEAFDAERALALIEVHDALTGHSEGKVSRDYGVYYVRSVLYPAIEAMLSPFDIEEDPDALHQLG